MKFGVVVFPGSNCDHDAFYALSLCKEASVQYIWHKETQLPNGIDCIILPGGFSYGDYLRCGAIARFSSIMDEVIRFANYGGYVIGICNGFQILTECQLLPGVLLKNKSLSFICKDVYIKVVSNSPFTYNLAKNEILKIPIAHFEGNYFANDDTIKELEDNHQIVFRYCNKNGEISDAANPNGSINNIAGIMNRSGNILGLMPHPERYSDKILGYNDGLKLFHSLINYFYSIKEKRYAV